jgi:hypothetical protein
MICFALPLCFGTSVLNCPITTFVVICQTLIKSTYLILSISSFKDSRIPKHKGNLPIKYRNYHKIWEALQ